MTTRWLIGVAVAALGVLASADAQQICCSAGGSGSISFPLTAPNGSASAPSYSFANGADSGMYANAGGSVTIIGSSPSATGGGNVSVNGGSPTAGNNNGGAVTLTGGNAHGVGSPGNVTVTAGNAGSGIPGGSVTIQGGTTPGNGVQGGSIFINSGAGTGGFRVGAPIVFTTSAGAGTGGGSGGNLNIVLGVGAPNGSAAGTANVTAGAGSGNFHLAGLINTAVTPVGNGADLTEDTLQSYSLPANSLESVGRCVRVTSWGTTANNTDLKTIKVYFGASQISSGASGFQNMTWIVHLTVCKTGSNTQSVIGDMMVGTTAIAPSYTTGADADSSAITIKTTGQAGAANANDILSQGQIVEYLS